MDELYQEAMKKGIEVVLENYVDPLLHKIGDKIRGAGHGIVGIGEIDIVHIPAGIQAGKAVLQIGVEGFVVAFIDAA